MRCLNCQTEMTNYDVITKAAELSYDVCEKCGSIWLDRGELDKMAFEVSGSIEFSSEGGTSVTEDASKDCPRCDDSRSLRSTSSARATLFCIIARIAVAFGSMAAN